MMANKIEQQRGGSCNISWKMMRSLIKRKFKEESGVNVRSTIGTNIGSMKVIREAECIGKGNQGNKHKNECSMEGNKWFNNEKNNLEEEYTKIKKKGGLTTKWKD